MIAFSFDGIFIVENFDGWHNVLGISSLEKQSFQFTRLKCSKEAKSYNYFAFRSIWSQEILFRPNFSDQWGRKRVFGKQINFSPLCWKKKTPPENIQSILIGKCSYFSLYPSPCCPISLTKKYLNSHAKDTVLHLNITHKFL